MAQSDSKAPIRLVKRVQFGILSPDEIVSIEKIIMKYSIILFYLLFAILASDVSY